MPDDRGWAERDNSASLLNAPAEIDVVAGLAIFGIEPAYTFEGPTVKSHITTGNMLGDGVREQHMIRPARRGSDARLDPVLCGRRDVRSANTGIIATEERANQVIQPIGIGHAVRIGIGEDIAFGSGR